MTLPLDALTSNEFIDTAQPISTDQALYHYLQRAPVVRELAKAIRADCSTPNDEIEQFVARLLHRFRPGRRFAFDASLAAVVVALELYPAPFATKFIEELAGAKVAEIPLAPRVARLVLEGRKSSVIAETRRTARVEPRSYDPDFTPLIRTRDAKGIGTYRIGEQAA